MTVRTKTPSRFRSRTLAIATRLLVLLGATALVPLRATAQSQRGPWPLSGSLEDSAGRPLPGLSVFLDRGSNTIERYVTDSLGGFHFLLNPREYYRATWLICPPGSIPSIGYARNGDPPVVTNYTYVFSPARDTVEHFYKARGWKGPIPRECPPAADEMLWRFPASAKKGSGAASSTEPDWVKYPGPPNVPPR
ncbi:MAG TPA: hypothetical protein VGD77_12515 [Gemmatimonadaceae bacterium]